MRLQAKLAFTVALAAALAIVTMGAAFWVLSANQQRGDVDEGLIRVANEPRQFLDVAANRGRGGRTPAEFGPGGAVAADDRLFTRVRVSIDGVTLLDDGLPEVDALPEGTESIVSTVEIDGDRYRMAVAPTRGRRSGVIQVARNIEDLESGLARLRKQIAAAGIAGIALAGLLGALVARRLSSPITKVANAAREMSFGSELPSPIDVDRNDEVGDLASSFNQMLGALELSRDQQQRLVADASHELRTPLTSLRLKLDLLDSTPDLPEGQRQELLSASATEVEKLGELVTELVVLATDPSGVEDKAVEQSLSTLVRELAVEHQQRSGRQVNVVVEGGDGTRPMRVRLVRRAVTNLIDNAIKYSADASLVTVTVTNGTVEVRDQGEGIPPEDLEFVFDRFYRSPTARTRPGNGIGLAIVKRVAEIHGGQTWARNATDPTGAIVGFSLG